MTGEPTEPTIQNQNIDPNQAFLSDMLQRIENLTPDMPIAINLGGDKAQNLANAQESHVAAVGTLARDKLGQMTTIHFDRAGEGVMMREGGESHLLGIVDRTAQTIVEENENFDQLEDKAELVDSGRQLVVQVRKEASKQADSRHVHENPSQDPDYDPTDPTSLLSQVARDEFNQKLCGFIEGLETLVNRDVQRATILGKLSLKQVVARQIPPVIKPHKKRWDKTPIKGRIADKLDLHNEPELFDSQEAKDKTIKIALFNLQKFIDTAGSTKKIPREIDAKIHEDVANYEARHGTMDSILTELRTRLSSPSLDAELKAYLDSEVVPKIAERKQKEADEKEAEEARARKPAEETNELLKDLLEEMRNQRGEPVPADTDDEVIIDADVVEEDEDDPNREPLQLDPVDEGQDTDSAETAERQRMAQVEAEIKPEARDMYDTNFEFQLKQLKSSRPGETETTLREEAHKRALVITKTIAQGN